jgi:H/ACA ribonucleoprotein complex subunit 1
LLQVPYFNAPIWTQGKSLIGKVDEIFGPINASMFTVKMAEGMVATSYKEGDKYYIDPFKLLPLDRFLPKPKGAPGAAGGRGGRGGRDGGRGGGRFGGRGGFGGRDGGELPLPLSFFPLLPLLFLLLPFSSFPPL